MPHDSLELKDQHPVDGIVAKSTVEQLLGASLEGDGRTFADATAQVLIIAEKYSCRETVGCPGVA